MSAPIFSVTFTAGLIEKLAGVKKPVAKAKQGHPAQQGTINPEVVILKRQNAQLGTALESSRRVGRFLLKNEEEELQKISELSGELLKEHSYPPKPIPCFVERLACVNCYKENSQNPLKCADVVDAYSLCANKAFNLRR